MPFARLFPLLTLSGLALLAPVSHAPAAMPYSPTAYPRGPKGGPIPMADSIVIEKKAHRLTLYAMGRPMQRYFVALGGSPIGDKQYAGDRRTPEGVFHVDRRNANSQFHLSLHLSYPDSSHRVRAESLGRSPGGDIEIHGLPLGREHVGAKQRATDWTDGCIALTNEEIDSIWGMVGVGTPVQIKP